jgi:hypothetical protein
MRALLLPAAIAVLAAGAAQAQQLYRWIDEKGRQQITDTPPPASAKGVQAPRPAVTESAKPPAAAPGGPVPFEVSLAMKDFPVVLYTATTCKRGCDLARQLLNRRGIPFREVQVFDDATNEELRKISGGNDVPTMMVGRSTQRGFEQGAYDLLLDSARYPKAGTVPERSQAAPPPPNRDAKAEAKPAEEPKAAAGPYSPKAPVKPQAEAARPYAPIPGKDQPLTGPYGSKSQAPAEDKK